MAEVTPNIGLKKPLESEFVSINTLNENMDSIDQALGALDELPTSSANVAGAISEIYDQLENKPNEQLTLTQGVQVVQGGDVPAILHPTMQGRTLVNLLGRDGSFESLTMPGVGGIAPTISTIRKKSGLSCLKAAASNTLSYSWKDYPYKLDTSKYFIVGAWVYIESYSSGANIGVLIQDFGAFSTKHSAYVDTSKIGEWQFIYARIPLSNLINGNGFRIVVGCPGVSTATVYFDEVRIYEVSLSDYNAIGTTITGSAIDRYFPYVDDMKHVNAVYIENKGRNLLPPFSEWTLHANAVVKESYELTIDATGVSQFCSTFVPCLPNVEYTLSITSSGGGTKSYLQFSENGIIPIPEGVAGEITNSGKASVISPSNAKYIRVRIDNGAATSGTFTFTNPMLNIGSEALPFEPQRPSYIYLPDCNLRSNVDGRVADRLYKDGQGKPRVMRRFQEVQGNSLEWVFHYDMVGFKAVKFSRPTNLMSYQSSTVIKFDGSFIPSTGNITNGANLFTVDATHFYLSISDNDSGWGESYTPTADEIKAYFYGWRMYQDGIADDTTPYSSGTKAWRHIVPAGVTRTGHTTTLPTTVNPLSSWTPYRLMYQLAQSVDEPVSYEGSLMLHEGDNLIEVGTGIVIRESAIPSVQSTGFAYINVEPGGYTKLSTRLLRFIGIFRSGKLDKSWTYNHKTMGAAYGEYYAVCPIINYNLTAAYSVTYLALDTYALGIAPQTISAEYAPNIRESVESLVRELVEARTETSVLANTKAQKQQPQWINATLMSDWMGTLQYRKNEQEQLEISISVTSGVVTNLTRIATLPVGYRPSQTLVIRLNKNATGSMVNGEIYINKNGTVTVAASSSLETGTVYQATAVSPTL